jgi:hypothetical protein
MAAVTYSCWLSLLLVPSPSLPEAVTKLMATGRRCWEMSFAYDPCMFDNGRDVVNVAMDENDREAHTSHLNSVVRL